MKGNHRDFIAISSSIENGEASPQRIDGGCGQKGKDATRSLAYGHCLFRPGRATVSA
jgi:hypothetical protein